MVDAMLLHKEAEAQHITDNELLHQVAGDVAAPSMIDVERGWRENYESLRSSGDSLGKYRITQDHEDRARMEAVRKYLGELEKRAGVIIELKQPAFRLQASRGPCRLGAPGAPTVLTVFLDYECPYCLRLNAVLKDLLRSEGVASRLSIDIKHLPLSIHHSAFDSAVAATCAALQGKFAAVHDQLFANRDHSSQAIDMIAESAGVDMRQFRACSTSDAVKRQVLSDMQEATVNAIEATPALFLNGVAVPLGQDIEDVRRSILSRVHAAVAPGSTPTQGENTAINR